MQRYLKPLFKFSFGLLILGILLYKVGFQNIFNTLKTVELFWIYLAILIFISTFVVGTYKLILLFKRAGYIIPFPKIFRYSFLSWAFGTVTPGKVGEFSLIYFLKKEGVPIGKCTAITIIYKFTTLSIYALITIIGIAYFFTFKDLIKIWITLTAFLGIILFLISSEKSRGLIQKIILRKYAEKFRGFSKTFFYFMKKEKKTLLLSLGINICKHVLNALQPFVLFLSLNTYIAYHHIFLITGILIGLSIVPITISGLGIKETASVFLYSYIADIPAEIVVSGAILALIIKYGTAAIGSIIFLGRKQIRMQ